MKYINGIIGTLSVIYALGVVGGMQNDQIGLLDGSLRCLGCLVILFTTLIIKIKKEERGEW